MYASTMYKGRHNNTFLLCSVDANNEIKIRSLCNMDFESLLKS